MITLRAGAAEATILPAQGAAFAALRHAGRDLLLPIPPGANPNAGFHGSFLMAPWTNRLDGGRIAAAGAEWRMPINRPAEGNALHGFLREMPWTVEQADPAALVLSCRFHRPPFTGAARMEVKLAEDALRLAVALANEGAAPTPMGIGWHPYFPRPAGTRLQVAARIAFGRDPRGLPIAPRPSAGLNGADGVLLGLDGHFAGWDGTARITWPDGRALRMQARGDWASNLQVYAPRGAEAIAVEPVSHAPDAANRAFAAAHGPMHLLRSGESLSASLTIHWC